MDKTHQLFKSYEVFYSPENWTVILKNAELWKSFHDMDTEMIITKNGRRMFPALQVQISKLEPLANYCILLEMNPASRCRYKYTSSGGWAPAGTEEAQSPQRIYLHPDSPAPGEYWMSQTVSFGRLKLTNTPAPPVGHLVLSSMHKYQPRIVICKTSDPRAIAWAPSTSVVFPETQFIAVTAYQNEKITKLKIDNNPFAKGFREKGQSKRKRKDSDKITEEDKSTKQPKVETSPLRIEDDRLTPDSICSTPPSPEEVCHKQSVSPKSTQICPISYPPLLPHPPNIYPYYTPYHIYSPLNFMNYYSPCYHHCTWQSPTKQEDLSTHQVAIKEVSKRPTDFSIRAITGYL